MLSVKGLLFVEHTTLKVDEYVPLQFWCLDCADAVPLYWLTGDFAEQLLEVGLNPHSGAICTITLTGFGSHVIKADEGDHDAIDGIPLCDQSLWSDYETQLRDEKRFRGEKSTFRVSLGENSVRLDLSPTSVVNRWFVAGRVEFGVDSNNNLIALNFTPLNAEEMNLLRFSLPID